MARNNSFEDIIESNLDKIEAWVEGNNTDKEIADKLGIAYSTYRKYKSTNVALKGRIATAKDKKNQEVEKALFKKCIGYKYTEEVATKIKEEVLDKETNIILVKESVVVNEVKKFSLPDLGAQKFYLVNRVSAKWKEDPNKVSNDKKLTKLKEIEVNAKTGDI
ncbi:Xaa-His dipeptidase [Clostridium tagluense]|uniref:Xaa-His dipeptidase n=1 Tax=Clostridium tagluense TaxID=360422 RepID=A0A401UUH3_9CLOT|nr:Xaa-His dipeptidase [Clostridium tagluense]GCD13193.1 hypothetical protein Ctaglu_48160 [Clostridium tagluense]